jgi:DNA-binding transcriptional LysR family regulator
LNNRPYSHELLRTLVTVIDSGGFAKAAEILNQTQPAISLQIKRLEEQTEQALFEKVGRQLQPTAAGYRLAEYGRKILAINLEAVQAMQGFQLDGLIRLSAPQDIAEDYLPDVLGKFVAAYPRMQLEVKVERNQQLVKGIANHDYDVAIATVDKQFQWQPEQRVNLKRLNSLNMQWLAAANFSLPVDDVLPLVLLEPPCLFRTRAIEALDAAQLKYRIAYITASLAGLRAAVEAGLGVTARLASREDYSRNIEPITRMPLQRLPKLGSLNTYLYHCPDKRTSATQLLCELLQARVA